ncbi:hypothetical protein [Gracilimonas sp.]|uniref:hypothetical protein n=1 Tax=Gracilimonas sp. TaxID=1974203 RepID=UPI003BAD3052
MDTKNRQVNTRIWDQPHFTRLTGSQKLFWWFINSMCNNAGIYEHNPKLAEFHCDTKIDIDDFVESVNFEKERVRKVDESALWIKDFIRDTWGTITANNVGLSCYRALVRYNVQDAFINEYPSCINEHKFWEYIEDKSINLPLPKGRPTPELKQGNGKPTPINIPISSAIIISTLNTLTKAIPKHVLDGMNDLATQGDLESAMEKMKEGGIHDPSNHIIEKAQNTNWDEITWDDFITGCTQNFEQAPF